MSQSLNYAILNQAIALIRDGNMRRARALGFSEAELRALRRMSASDLEELAREKQVICRVSVDHEMLLARIRRLTQDQDRESKIDRCLELGASVTMMGKFFGLTPNDCSTRRSLLGLETRQGRQALPPEKEEHDAWHRWQSISPDAKDPTYAPDDLNGMMALAEETGLSLTAIWSLVKTWVNADPSKDPDEDAPKPSADIDRRGGSPCRA
ncbi:DUF2857 domain-containing protein [Halomonas colorata]|uniref:DUF2857 domain-containing protein n=1 Tax=Halomonas colorata TaxID=2742615 RepID=UPI00186673C6|nr:DUF2857 domain-containing protein [Halomonas colorata]